MEDSISLYWIPFHGIGYPLTQAMASQAFNQVIEWKRDKVMTRTCNRPIPIERITRLQGGLIGGLFFITSNVLMYYVY
jgi:protoheme IX farnesyltransferase